MSITFKPLIIDEDFYTHHITFTSCNLVSDITKPLNNLGIYYFTFERIFYDDSHIKLTNTKEWLEHYYRKELYNFSIFEKTPNMFENNIFFWQWLNQDLINSEASLFNIKYIATITQKHKTYCDFYHFGTNINNHTCDSIIYLHISQLYKFIALFKHKTVKLLQEVEFNKLLLQREVSRSSINQRTDKNISDLCISKVKRFYLGEEFNNSYLTLKELQILKHLSDGKKLVDIADILFVSQKTIETHIINIKTKLNCKTMFELGQLTHNIVSNIEL